MKIPTMAHIILRIVSVVILAEIGVMMALIFRGFELGPYTIAVLDAVILAILITPIIYLWIIKPYVIAHDADLYQVSIQAHRDPLTELPNRRLLEAFIEKLLPVFHRHNLYGALLFIDLDGFKEINDKNGHDAGDAVLVEVARRLMSLVRSEDIVSRIGGDEFVIVLEQLDTDKHAASSKALAITRRIQQELARVVYFKGVAMQIDSSIGLRFLTPERVDVETVLKDADTAMYRAKKAGKGRIVIFDAGDANVIRKWPVHALP
ncbi:MAG: GGDEF domain-containing protein [Gammaproteobacteria bacterium]|nr:GGDEF domain-containing protein [Gammaproteobacteria bacterium]